MYTLIKNVENKEVSESRKLILLLVSCADVNVSVGLMLLKSLRILLMLETLLL
jgi:hypothetical protein